MHMHCNLKNSFTDTLQYMGPSVFSGISYHSFGHCMCVGWERGAKCIRTLFATILKATCKAIIIIFNLICLKKSKKF